MFSYVFVPSTILPFLHTWSTISKDADVGWMLRIRGHSITVRIERRIHRMKHVGATIPNSAAQPCPAQIPREDYIIVPNPANYFF